MFQAVAWGAMRSLEHASSAASVISKISQVKSVLSNDTDAVLLRLLDSIATRADMLRAPLNFCSLWCQNKSSSIADICFHTRNVINNALKFLTHQHQQLQQPSPTPAIPITTDSVLESARSWISDLEFCLNTLSLAMSSISAQQHLFTANRNSSSTPVSLTAVMRVSNRICSTQSGDLCLFVGSFFSFEGSSWNCLAPSCSLVVSNNQTKRKFQLRIDDLPMSDISASSPAVASAASVAPSTVLSSSNHESRAKSEASSSASHIQDFRTSNSASFPSGAAQPAPSRSTSSSHDSDILSASVLQLPRNAWGSFPNSEASEAAAMLVDDVQSHQYCFDISNAFESRLTNTMELSLPARASSEPQLTDTALLWTQSSTAVERRYCFVFHSHAINPLELVYMLRLCAYENEAARDGQLAHTELSDEELTLLLQNCSVDNDPARAFLAAPPLPISEPVPGSQSETVLMHNHF